MNSCEDSTTNEAVTSVLSSSTGLEANEALSTTSHGFSSHNQCMYNLTKKSLYHFFFVCVCELYFTF